MVAVRRGRRLRSSIVAVTLLLLLLLFLFLIFFLLLLLVDGFVLVGVDGRLLRQGGLRRNARRTGRAVLRRVEVQLRRALNRRLPPQLLLLLQPLRPRLLRRERSSSSSRLRRLASVTVPRAVAAVLLQRRCERLERRRELLAEGCGAPRKGVRRTARGPARAQRRHRVRRRQAVGQVEPRLRPAASTAARDVVLPQVTVAVHRRSLLARGGGRDTQTLPAAAAARSLPTLPPLCSHVHLVPATAAGRGRLARVRRRQRAAADADHPELPGGRHPHRRILVRRKGAPGLLAHRGGGIGSADAAHVGRGRGGRGRERETRQWTTTPHTPPRSFPFPFPTTLSPLPFTRASGKVFLPMKYRYCSF
eukprot:Rhum_TRINITY_DN4456_c0_g1::Rhum_TRINITY_DN4456_c0_g1_i1::g.14489::m.14489